MSVSVGDVTNIKNMWKEKDYWSIGLIIASILALLFGKYNASVALLGVCVLWRSKFEVNIEERVDNLARRTKTKTEDVLREKTASKLEFHKSILDSYWPMEPLFILDKLWDRLIDLGVIIQEHGRYFIKANPIVDFQEERS